MLRIMAPTFAATLTGGIVLDVKSATVELGESSAPYGHIGMVCALPDPVTYGKIDPRNLMRGTVTMGDRANLFAAVPAITRTFDLVLDRRELGAVAGEVSVDLYTDEAILIRRRLLASTPRDWAQTTTRGLVNAVLGAVLGTALQAGDAIDQPIDAGAAIQAPGVSYWDFLDGTLQGAGLRLWCDESRKWRLSEKSAVIAGVVSLAHDGTVTGINDAIGADELYADSVVIHYGYQDAFGNAKNSYDYASSSSSPVRTALIEYQSAPAIGGAARRHLRRLRGRGRVTRYEAVGRYDASPSQSFLGTLPDGAPTQAGIVSEVSWRVPEDRMTVATRELTDTASTSWGAQPAGATWSSIAVGVKWNGYLAIPWASVPAGETWNTEPAGYRWREYGNG